MSRVRIGLLGVVAVILGGLVVPSVLAQFPPVPRGGMGPNMPRVPQSVWVCQGCRKEIGTGAFPPDTCPFCKVRIINGVGKGGDHPFQPDGGGLGRPNPGGIAPPSAPTPPPLGPGGGFTPPGGGGVVPPGNQQPQPFSPPAPPGFTQPNDGRQQGVQPQPFGQPPQFQPQDGTGGQQGMQPQPPGLVPMPGNPGGDFNQPNGWQPANVPQSGDLGAQSGSVTPPHSTQAKKDDGNWIMWTAFGIIGTAGVVLILAVLFWIVFLTSMSRSRTGRPPLAPRRRKRRRPTRDDDDDDDDDEYRPRGRRW